MSFNTLGLSEKLLLSVAEQGYETPTEIQSKAIPAILKKIDIIGNAQTGTGKTASYILPLLNILNKPLEGRKKRPVRALILVPTRELAVQVEECVKIYGQYLSLKSTAVYGGVNIFPQKRKLRQGIDILVATPGRLLDHVNQKTVDLSKIEILVLDEADRILDMGFIHDIRKITDLLPQKRQNLLFSATFSSGVKKLALNILNEPEVIKIKNNSKISDLTKQLLYPVDRERKNDLLIHLIKSENWQQVLVFTRTKIGADNLTKYLKKNGINSLAIHGDKRQRERSETLAKFKDYKLRVLVATDIAARGLDIDQLPHVVNFELPYVSEDYIHRIGRTGRAGHEGKAISLVCKGEHKQLREIQKLLNCDLPKEIIPGFEPKPAKKAKKASNSTNRKRNNASNSRKKIHDGKKNVASKKSKKNANISRKNKKVFKKSGANFRRKKKK